MTKNILLVGVGGQGTILMSKILTTGLAQMALLKAIEAGATIDTDLFKTQPAPTKTIKEKLLARFTAACIVSAIGLFTCITTLILSFIGGAPSEVIQGFIVIGGFILAVGIALFIVYFVGKRMLAREIEAEEKSLNEKEK